MIYDHPTLNGFYQYAISLCGAEADAYDLLQSALEKYLQGQRGGSRSIDNPRAYMRQIIRNLFIDQYRQPQFHRNDEFDEQIHTKIPDIYSYSLENLIVRQDLLEKIWQHLNHKERELLYLWGLLGHTIDEIALELECPRGTLLARIHRLRKKLQKTQSLGASA
jgi:RNA polymerase sigma factor (sigma-70 family)